MVWKKVTNSDAGDSTHFGGDDVDKISETFNAGTQTDPINIKDENLLIVDPADTAKKVRFDAGGITSSQTRVITIPDANITMASTVVASTSVAGLMSAADKTKIDAIEASATADQTNAQIVAAVEAGTDSNTFTDADHTKLNAIEASATADQTGAQIKTAYQAETNAFTDTLFSKLGAIEASATADQSNAEIVAAVEAGTDSNTFTDADHSKLNAIEASATADQSNAEIRTAVGAATDSNVFTDANVTTLGNRAPLASPALTGNATAVNLTLSGDLTVNGTTTTLNTTNLAITDKNIMIADGSSNNAASNGAGITIEGGSDADKTITWATATGDFDISENIDIASGKVFKVNGATTLSATALGSAVLASSLTSVGTLASPVLTTPNIGTPSAGVLTNCTALPAAQVAQGTMASGMVLVAPVLGTPASGALTNCTALPAAQVAQGTMASGMVMVAPVLGTPASGALTNCTALPAAQVSQGTMQSGMVLVAPVLGTPASGALTNCTAIPMAQASGIIPDANMPNLTGAITTVEGAVATTLVANAVDSDHYVDGSIDLIHMSVNSIDSDQYVDASIDLAHLAADSVDGTKIANDAIDSEHYTDASIDVAHMSANSVDSDQYVDASIDSEHLSTGLTINDPTLTFSIRADTSTAYVPVLADAGKVVTLNNGSATTCIIPTNANVAFPVGCSLTWIQIGSGAVTISGISGVTVTSSGGTAASPAITAQHNSATAIKTATNSWTVIGAIE